MSLSHGPALIYDKSTIQSLSKNESRWLHHHFHVVMTSIFLIELAGNLHKTARLGSTPESEVALISSKIPSYGFTPTVSYDFLIEENLLGNDVVMDGRPLLGGGRRIPNPDGGYGVFFDEAPEAKIMRRWQEQDFTGMERDVSAQWKRDLEALDLRPIKQSLRDIKQKRPDIKTDNDLFSFIQEYVASPLDAYRVLMICLDVFGISNKLRRIIINRWKRLGRPTLGFFAPYAAYALRVELFFMFGMAFDFIADTRPRHRSDFSYFYYLPFTRVFASSDKLHIRFAPGLLRSDQLFVDGRALKNDLAKMVAYYDSLPDNEKLNGMMTYARFPPKDGNFLIARMYDQLYPEWREDSDIPKAAFTPKQKAELLEKIQKWEHLAEQAKAL